MPKPPRPVLPVLTPEQIQRLLSQPDQATATGTRDRALLALVYATGITARKCAHSIARTPAVTP